MATTPALPPEIKESKTFEITVTEYRRREPLLTSLDAKITLEFDPIVTPSGGYSDDTLLSVELSPTAVPIYVSHLLNEIEDLTNQQAALKIKENAVRAEIAQLSSVKED